MALPALAIHLLGVPAVERHGVRAAPPRGRKAWALLAYLLGTESAHTRQWLAELLFEEADNPLNALSWNLTELRRLLGAGASVGGEIVLLELPTTTFVDIRTLTTGAASQAVQLPGLGHEMLEGMSFPSSPAFEIWLLTERRRLAGATEDVLREAARNRLASGETELAIELAGRLARANPLDEDAQELLIRAYATAGDRVSANRQLDACIALFRRELGTDPIPAIMRAAQAVRFQAAATRIASRPGIEARLEAGVTAFEAGAVETAIGALRAAVAEAFETDDIQLQRRALLELGSALVHGVRGQDGEGAGVLHQAIALVEPDGTDETAARVHRELGYIEMLRGRYQRARRWLRRATALAANASVERAWAHAMQGVALTDVGRHSDALAELNEALHLGKGAEAGAVQAWALTFIGRSRLLRGELGAARDALEPALQLARQMRWTAFVPLPESLLADVDLAEGNIDSAAASYEHAYQLSLQLGDPCWEGMAARGIGLVAERRGDSEGAIGWVIQARTRCVRLPDAWLWVEAYCLDALCTLGIEHQQPEAARWIDDLEALAARTGMREMVARAYLHRERIGIAVAGGAARVLAAEVDNPALFPGG